MIRIFSVKDKRLVSVIYDAGLCGIAVWYFCQKPDPGFSTVILAMKFSIAWFGALLLCLMIQALSNIIRRRRNRRREEE